VSHSYASCLYHCVWSTKQRQRIIVPELQERLWPYLGGIAQQNRMKALAIGGVEDHLHLLLSTALERQCIEIAPTYKRWIFEVDT